jgi:predicted Zn-dependent peptidase
MLDELRQLSAEGVSEDELVRAKVQLKSELVMRGESAGSRMSAIMRSWWFERRLVTIPELKDAVDGVTREQIMALLGRFPPSEALVIGAIGPRTEAELVGGGSDGTGNQGE